MHEASKMTGYHQDYLGQVARAGKLKARKMGRNWFTSKLAIDIFLGRVKAEDPIAPEMETVVAPIALAEVAVDKVPAPAPEKISEPVAVQAAAPAIGINIIRARPAPVQGVGLAGAAEPAAVLVALTRRAVVVNVLSVSPDAGPNLQEAIAVPRPERLRLPPSVGLENKNKFYRLNKLVSSRRVAGQPERDKGRFFAGALPVRPMPWPALSAVAVVMLAAAIGSAYYFSDSFSGELPPMSQEQVAGASTSAVGRGRITAGQSQAVVNNDSIDPDSVILVSFRSQVAGRHWITDQSPGRFTLMLTEPAAEDLLFDYWVAGAPAGDSGMGGPRQ